MATIKVKLTKDHLSLISNIRFKEKPEYKDNVQEADWGIDFNSLYGGSFLLEDISYILGCYDKHIEGTEDSFMGVRFEEDLEGYMLGLHKYILDNIEYIEEILHQFCTKGGLSAGVYSCKSNQRIWVFEG